MIEDIYALCDMELLGRFDLTLEDFVDIAKRFNASILQYRDKNGTAEEKNERLRQLRKLWDRTLIVNDEIALARFCDGVHIGQEDLRNVMDGFGAKSKNEAIVIVRKLSGAKIVGLSTHTLQEVQEANTLDVDYIGLGAYRASRTKEVEYVLGPNLSNLAKCSRHDVVAIGGVQLFDHIENIWKKAIATDLVIKALTYA